VPEPIPAVDSSGTALAGRAVVIGAAAGIRCRVVAETERWFNIDDARPAVVNAVLGHRVRRRRRPLHLDLAPDLSPAPIPVEAGPPAITAW
jgi:hypothetical protein